MACVGAGDDFIHEAIRHQRYGSENLFRPAEFQDIRPPEAGSKRFPRGLVRSLRRRRVLPVTDACSLPACTPLPTGRITRLSGGLVSSSPGIPVPACCPAAWESVEGIGLGVEIADLDAFRSPQVDSCERRRAVARLF